MLEEINNLKNLEQHLKNKIYGRPQRSNDLKNYKDQQTNHTYRTSSGEDTLREASKPPDLYQEQSEVYTDALTQHETSI